MIGKHVLFKSNTDEWSTPDSVFEALDQEFHFTLDPCATAENHKCIRYFTKEKDGLERDWGGGSCLLQSAIFSDQKMG